MKIEYVNPIPGYIIIKPDKPEERTSTGIYLPKSATEQTFSFGTIVSLGNKLTQIVYTPEVSGTGQGKQGILLKLNNKIIFKKWSGESFNIGDDEYIFIPFDSIIGTINEGEKTHEDSIS